MKNFLRNKTLEWVNERRAEHGLSPVSELDSGMWSRLDECSVARSIAPGQTKIGYEKSEIFGREHPTPFWVYLFIFLFDRGMFNEYHTPRPLRYSDSVDHLDFKAEKISEDRPVELVE